jgi:hypothetical protein
MRAHKQQRIAYCELESCLKPLDPTKLAKRPTLRFCSRAHAVIWLQQQGHYQAIGVKGNQVQSQIKAQTGHVPKYEKRRDAVAQSNREHPRRSKA